MWGLEQHSLPCARQPAGEHWPLRDAIELGAGRSELRRIASHRGDQRRQHIDGVHDPCRRRAALARRDASAYPRRERADGAWGLPAHVLGAMAAPETKATPRSPPSHAVHFPPRSGQFCPPVHPPHAGVAAPLSYALNTPTSGREYGLVQRLQSTA